MDEISSVEELGRLGVSLGIGLTIGLERGWKERDAPEGSRIAGWRTFGLIGLAGGAWSDLAGSNLIVLAIALLSVAIVLSVAHWQEVAADGDRGTTTLMAAIVTFALGGLAGRGHTVEAAAGAVVVTFLLSAKSVLHSWLRRLSEKELQALLRFLLISVVILPLLPDRGMGPYDALNPYELWTMVVLVAGLSFVGYAAMRIWGQRAGAMVTALFGGIVSSTAIALDFARRSVAAPAAPRVLAAGVMAASSVSFARTMVLVSLFQIRLLPSVAIPVAALVVTSAATAWFLWKRADEPALTQSEPLGNPLELRSALQLAVVLALMLVALEWFQVNFGSAGLDAMTALAGTVDIDAATISICRMVETGLETRSATIMLLFGLAGNAVLKVAIVSFVGRRALWGRVALSYALTALAGAIVAFFAI